MPIRNTHRVGDSLMVDEESGHTVYRSQVTKIWDGTFRRTKSFETRQPQEFIKARNDPTPLTDVRSAARLPTACNVDQPYIGNTGIKRDATLTSPAAHLYRGPGIGEAEIQCDFAIS